MVTADRNITINIDTGGTFTDGVLSDGVRTHSLKVLTTPHDLTLCFRNLLTLAAERLDVNVIEMLKHTAAVRYSTTVGTNAVIERKGPRIGLLISAEEVSELASLPGDGILADILSPFQSWIRGVDTAAEGLQPGAVLNAVEELLQEGAERLVVCLSGKSAQATEAEAKRIILEEYPRHILGALPILFSTELTADEKFPRRMATAVMNAYLHPALEHFLYNAEDILRERKYPFPLFVFGNDGTTNRVSKVTALKTYHSGPSGGVEAARFLAQHYKLPALVSIDIGGTSTDCAFVIDGRHEEEPVGNIEDQEISFAIRTIHALGAGGGTIAKVTDGRFELGPESAGAAPGPACFGFGGELPTVTDANVVIGYFNPEGVFASQVTIDAERARKAVARFVAEPLGMTTEEAGAKIRDTLEKKAGEYLAARLNNKGLTPGDVVLATFGGAGPAHACGIADQVGIGKVLVPSLCSVFSAFGVGTSNVVHRYEANLPSDDVERLGSIVEAMTARANVDMKGEGFNAEAVSLSWYVNLVRNGKVAFHAKPRDIEDWQRVVESAPAKDRGTTTQVVLEAVGHLLHVDFPNGIDAGAPQPSPIKHRAVAWKGGKKTGTPIYEAKSLTGKAVRVPGPAIIEADDSTLVVPPTWVLKTDPHHQYILEKES